MTRSRALLSALLPLAVLVLSACGSDDKSSPKASTGAATTRSAAAACTPGQLATRTKGTLTVATDKPAYPPYFSGDDPTNGKGFESAVAYAIAGKLGFARGDVKWTVVPFNSSYAPGPKSFDFDVNQISISAARAKRVDFSPPYFEAPQAILVPKGSTLKPTSLADLKDVQVGVQLGTTSLDAVNDTIKPSKQPKVFNDSNDTVRALKNKAVAAIVVDLPTAFYISSAQVEGSRIAGQFSAPGGDQWGALLQKGSKLTPCVSKVVSELKADGTLAKIQRRWLSADAGVPELK